MVDWWCDEVVGCRLSGGRRPEQRPEVVGPDTQRAGSRARRRAVGRRRFAHATPPQAWSDTRPGHLVEEIRTSRRRPAQRTEGSHAVAVPHGKPARVDTCPPPFRPHPPVQMRLHTPPLLSWCSPAGHQKALGMGTHCSHSVTRHVKRRQKTRTDLERSELQICTNKHGSSKQEKIS
jgi:hypothetical protein